MALKVLILESTHHVLKTEQLFIQYDLRFDIIPTPKHISGNCGLSIRFDPKISDTETITQMLDNQDIIYKIYDIQCEEI
ncbi:MAG TPA: DUF3343 domain-containing protein [Bacteroidales bacterium]|nr:DUF3343 domain-containing protein [Bacteroidales bacterium]